MIEKIYRNSPIWMQNVFVATAGLQLHMQRKGGNYKYYLQKIKENQLLSTHLVEKIQLNYLKQVISHSLESVPFYQEWSRKNRFTAADINCINDISVLPIIEKEDIRQNPKHYCSTKMLNKSGIFTLNTSGTTGKPLVVFCDKESRRHHFAYWERFCDWFGVGKNLWRATFCGRIAVPQKQKTSPFWRFDPFQKNVLFSSYHLSGKNMPFYLKKLREINPAYLDGYPSSLALVGNYMLDYNEPPIRGLKAAFTSAETLLPYQRDVIMKAFQVPVADQYGCTEMAAFISQCEHGSYHVNTDYSLIEVVNEKNEPVSPGGWGEAICTVFVNKTMPLIRYRLGDLLRSPEPSCCPCGRPFPVTKEIIGRRDDIVLTPDGRKIGRLDPAFKGISNIRETQIIQTDIDSLIVKLVASTVFSEHDRDRLLQRLKYFIGDDMNIQIEIVKEIQREPNGKFRSVISNIKNIVR